MDELKDLNSDRMFLKPTAKDICKSILFSKELGTQEKNE